MSKYILKDNQIIKAKQYNISELARRIGISRPTLSNILNKKQPCNKPEAYIITKILNNEKEIKDFFIEIN